MQIDGLKARGPDNSLWLCFDTIYVIYFVQVRSELTELEPQQEEKKETTKDK